MNKEDIMRWLESTEKVFKEVADAIGEILVQELRAQMYENIQRLIFIH